MSSDGIMICRLRFGSFKCGHTPPDSASHNESEVLFVFAVIETGGKQYRVQTGDVIYVEKLNAEADEEITFDKVVAVCNKTLKVGKPYVKDAFVKGTVLKNGKGKKITVFTYKPKKSSSRKMGHRQPYTKVQIEKIAL